MNETSKNYIIIALLVVVCILSYMLWSNNNDNADTIRQLKEHNGQLETRLTTAINKSDNLDKRLADSQRTVVGLRQEIAGLIDTITTITEREQGNQTIVERSLARIEQLESLIDEIGKAN